ncbi:hypothetical protein A9Q84_10570 [Halobacteriovorax marinus]|uniref:Uncharacterized protein n=1 Tax=Halobacteriovorax marinus TaxID=97084 RepID=A0A1Y5F789_9BACT|nr:hypothetical protein A9Q84_10570 [Halobacteriovorax marinus]
MKLNDWINKSLWKSLADAKLMELVAKDEKVAFAILFDRHKESLFNYALSILKDRAKSEEVVQEIFLKLYELRCEYKEMGKLSAYLYRMIRNKCFDSLKKKGEVLLGEDEDFSNQVDETFERVVTKARLELIDRLFCELKDVDREIFLLWAKGESIRSISNIVESSEGAVKTRLHRIKKDMIRKVEKRRSA